MKPLNLDNSPCSPISSNCVVWQGPAISCINLCTGDTVSDVIYKLATELCDIMTELNLNNYDLACLDLTVSAPTNFTELIQLLIDKICELQNVPAGTTGGGSGCPDCIVNVAQCLQSNGQTTMQLLDYVQLIANRVCNLVDQITTINNTLTTYNTRITNLENKPEPTFIIPSVLVTCDIGNIDGGTSAVLENVLTQLINGGNGYCALISATGTPTEIIDAVSLQTVGDGDVSIADCGLTMQQKYSTSWISNPNNLSESLIDVWIAIQDLRNGNKLYNVTAGNSNVTVTSTTSTTTCGTEKSFAVKAKSASVIAGTNITVATNTTDPYNTEYTVNATSNNTVVAQGDNTTVSSATVGTTTTYTVNSKEAIVTESTNTNNITNVTSAPGPAAGDTTYTVETLYGLDTFVAVVAINSISKPECGNLPIQTPGAGVMIGQDMRIIKKYNFVSLNNVETNNTTSAGAYVTTVTTLPFGTFDNLDGEVIITKPGTYQITGTLQLKSANASLPVWQSSGIGSFHLGLLSNNNDVFTGNSQMLQGPMAFAGASVPTSLPGVHTTVSLSATATVSVGSTSTVVRLGIFNFSDRNYDGTVYPSGDSIRFAITRLR